MQNTASAETIKDQADRKREWEGGRGLQTRWTSLPFFPVYLSSRESSTSRGPQCRAAAAACQDAVLGWLKGEGSVLGDGLEKIPLMNRRPGLRKAGQQQRLRPKSSSGLNLIEKHDLVEGNRLLWGGRINHPAVSSRHPPELSSKRCSKQEAQSKTDQSEESILAEFLLHWSEFSSVWIIHAGGLRLGGGGWNHNTAHLWHPEIQYHCCPNTVHPLHFLSTLPNEGQRSPHTNRGDLESRKCACF